MQPAYTLDAQSEVDHNGSAVTERPDAEEPVPFKTVGSKPRHSPTVRAQAVAMIAAGHSSAEVARQLGINKSTVLYWWREHAPSEPRSLAQRELLGQQVYDTVKTTLEALAARARLTADEDWIREQSAAALAHLDAVHWDRVIRLLSALKPAEPEEPEEAVDLEA